ncbi:MAG: RDD family protein, partial [Acidimicrobiaceae bacterium]|nr:RDD family protein [Acidimicrobiaceae bacterium]
PPFFPPPTPKHHTKPPPPQRPPQFFSPPPPPQYNPHEKTQNQPPCCEHDRNTPEYGRTSRIPPPSPSAQSVQAVPALVKLGSGEEIELGNLGNRLVAKIIDYFIFFLIIPLVAGFFLPFLLPFLSDSSDNVIFIIVLIPYGLYDVGMIATKGQTLGKMVMRIKVIRADNGVTPGWGKSFLRWIVYLILIVISILFLLSCISIIADRLNRAWHDRAAKTLVVRA